MFPRQGVKDDPSLVGRLRATFLKLSTAMEAPIMRMGQVWPQTLFFSVAFLYFLPGGQINDPSLWKHYSLAFLPATPSCPSRTLEMLFELTPRPSRALDSPRAVTSGTTENQGHRQVCCARRGGPRTLSRPTYANLDCAFVENALLFVVSTR